MQQFFLFLLSSFFFLNFSIAQNAVVGEWLTSDKEGKIEIYNCGDKVCGKVSWLAEPNEADGKPKKDINNPDEARHNDLIIGMNLLEGFEKVADNAWENGTIYDPKNGKTYQCKMTLVDADNMNVRGFIGFSLLGRTEKWTRVK